LEELLLEQVVEEEHHTHHSDLRMDFQIWVEHSEWPHHYQEGTKQHQYLSLRNSSHLHHQMDFDSKWELEEFHY